MGGVVHAKGHGAKEKVVENEHGQTLEPALRKVGAYGSFPEVQKREKRACHSEDRTGSASAASHRSPGQAKLTAGNAGDDVGDHKRLPAHQAFENGAKIPQAPHVQSDVHDADVDEGGTEEPPPLSAQGQRAKVTPPAHQGLITRLRPGDAGNSHGEKHKNVDRDNSARDDRRTSVLPYQFGRESVRLRPPNRGGLRVWFAAGA